MQLFEYLSQQLLDKSRLLAVTGITEQHLRWLQELGIMPKPAYRVSVDLKCESFFGAHDEQQQLEFYARGSVEWLNAINGKLSDDDPVAFSYQLFETRYQARAQTLADQNLLPARFGIGNNQLDQPGLKAHIAQEWLYFCDGIYGLCTRSGLPEDIADKEFAIALIDELTDQQQKPTIGGIDRQRLVAAVALLDQASSLFAPHERTRSSRYRCIDKIREKYSI